MYLHTHTPTWGLNPLYTHSIFFIQYSVISCTSGIHNTLPSIHNMRLSLCTSLSVPKCHILSQKNHVFKIQRTALEIFFVNDFTRDIFCQYANQPKNESTIERSSIWWWLCTTLCTLHVDGVQNNQIGSVSETERWQKRTENQKQKKNKIEQQQLLWRCSKIVCNTTYCDEIWSIRWNNRYLKATTVFRPVRLITIQVCAIFLVSFSLSSLLLCTALHTQTLFTIDTDITHTYNIQWFLVLSLYRFAIAFELLSIFLFPCSNAYG